MEDMIAMTISATIPTILILREFKITRFFQIQNGLRLLPHVGGDKAKKRNIIIHIFLLSLFGWPGSINYSNNGLLIPTELVNFRN